jgi:hypothetical protein
MVPGLAAWLLVLSTRLALPSRLPDSRHQRTAHRTRRRERFPEVFAEVLRDPSGTTFLCFLFFVPEAA